MLRIWGRRNSINVQKVLWAAAELAVDFELVETGGPFGGIDRAEFRARNPNGLVPVIDDDGFVLWESNVIVRYLAERYGMGALCPAEQRERYDTEKWMDWQTTAVWPAFRAAFMGMVRTPPEKRDQNAIDASMKETARVLSALEEQLGRTAFVGGERLTMGDIPPGAAIFRCLALGIERKDFPNVARWYDRLSERPGYREHVMLPLS